MALFAANAVVLGTIRPKRKVATIPGKINPQIPSPPRLRCAVNFQETDWVGLCAQIATIFAGRFFLQNFAKSRSRLRPRRKKNQLEPVDFTLARL